MTLAVLLWILKHGLFPVRWEVKHQRCLRLPRPWYHERMKIRTKNISTKDQLVTRRRPNRSWKNEVGSSEEDLIIIIIIIYLPSEYQRIWKRIDVCSDDCSMWSQRVFCCEPQHQLKSPHSSWIRWDIDVEICLSYFTGINMRFIHFYCTLEISICMYALFSHQYAKDYGCI